MPWAPTRLAPAILPGRARFGSGRAKTHWPHRWAGPSFRRKTARFYTIEAKCPPASAGGTRAPFTAIAGPRAFAAVQQPPAFVVGACAGDRAWSGRREPSGLGDIRA